MSCLVPLALFVAGGLAPSAPADEPKPLAPAEAVKQVGKPACLETCPTGARVFGNVLDPKSEIRWVLDHKRVFVLKEELGTRPRFFYFFDK